MDIQTKCLMFAEGTGKQYARAKRKGFPNTLINDEKQIEIVTMRNKGKSLREIAKEMGFLTVKTVVEHLHNYEEKEEFYKEWLEWWNDNESKLCIIPFRDVAKDVYSDNKITKCEKIGICTIADYIMLSVECTVREMQIIIKDTGNGYKERRKQIFSNIKEILK